MLQWFNSSFGSSHNLGTSSTQLEKLKGAGMEGVLQPLNHKPTIASQKDAARSEEQRKQSPAFCLVLIKESPQTVASILLHFHLYTSSTTSKQTVDVADTCSFHCNGLVTFLTF